MALAVAGAVGLGCSEPRGDAVAPRIRDSAGITIVENDQPTWISGEGETLDSLPALVIGNRSEAPYQFGHITGLARYGDGRIAVADGMNSEIRCFDSSGAFLRTIARRGEGPGEMAGQEFPSLVLLSGDTLLAQSGFRANFYGPDGEFLTTLTTSTGDRRAGKLELILGAFANQTMIVGSLPLGPSGGSARRVMKMAMSLVGQDSASPRVLDSLPYAVITGEGEAAEQWFAPVAAFAQTPNAFYYGLGHEYTIRRYSSSGRLERLIRRRWTPIPVTQADIDEYAVEWSKRWNRDTGAAYQRGVEALRKESYAKTIPAFSQFIADRTGRLWVREPHLEDAPGNGQFNTLAIVLSVWSVFDTAGIWLGDVRMPAGFVPFEIGADYVLGVARDDDNVQTVALYRKRYQKSP